MGVINKIGSFTETEFKTHTIQSDNELERLRKYTKVLEGMIKDIQTNRQSYANVTAATPDRAPDNRPYAGSQSSPDRITTTPVKPDDSPVSNLTDKSPVNRPNTNLEPDTHESSQYEMSESRNKFIDIVT